MPSHGRAHPAPETELGHAVRAGIDAPAQARRMVATLPLQGEALDRLLIVVSELVANSVRHSGIAAGEPIGIRVAQGAAHLSVFVHDGGPGFSRRVATGRRRRAGGHGLKIVGALAEDWEVRCGPDGCTVRATLDLRGGGLEGVERAPDEPGHVHL